MIPIKNSFKPVALLLLADYTFVLARIIVVYFSALNFIKYIHFRFTFVLFEAVVEQIVLWSLKNGNCAQSSHLLQFTN